MYVHKRTYSVHVYYIELHIVWHKNLMVIKFYSLSLNQIKSWKDLILWKLGFMLNFEVIYIYEVDFYPVYGL